MAAIELTCSCGASFKMRCDQFITSGGLADAQGRKFVAELRAEEWLDRHQWCIEANKEKKGGE